MSYKTEIARKLSAFHVKSPDQTNVGGFLADVYLWDTVATLAKGHLEDAWRALEREKIIPSDVTMRETVEGESIAAKTAKFQVYIKVSNPRTIFDKDTFIAKVAATFNVSKPKLLELAKECVSQTRAPLSKRVIEV